MPIYAMHCDACGKEQDIYRSVADMNRDMPDCCGVEMRRRICKPFVMADIAPYKSMIDGTMIESRSKHRTHLREHGMVEIGNEQPIAPRPKEIPKESIKKDLYETMTGYGL